ncbi:UNVERIFIED_CONTAM: LIM/homeobox protein Lhx2 [Gekko kuhli]
MLFHSLAGSEMHGVIDEMDRRAKGDAPAISSAIDRGETETHAMPSISSERAALCAGCGGKISDRYYLLAVDKQWHMRCLKCCECKLNLESELTCFSKDGSIYCKEDYYRRFSVQRCARCHLGISASEMVMRARDLVYHLNCFTCSTCAKMLTTGDHFGMKDNLVYCRLHFEALLQGEYQLHFNHAEGAAGKGPALGASAPLGLPYYNGVGTVQKGRPRKRKSPGPGADLAAYNADPPQFGLASKITHNNTEHLKRTDNNTNTLLLCCFEVRLNSDKRARSASLNASESRFQKASAPRDETGRFSVPQNGDPTKVLKPRSSLA